MAVLSYHHVTHEVRWMCIFWSPRAQAQFPHCSRFLLNYLGRFLNLRRPYLILPSLCDTGQGAQGLFRVPTCFATPTTSPLKKKMGQYAEVPNGYDLLKCFINQFPSLYNRDNNYPSHRDTTRTKWENTRSKISRMKQVLPTPSRFSLPSDLLVTAFICIKCACSNNKTHPPWSYTLKIHLQTCVPSFCPQKLIRPCNVFGI